MAKPTPSQDHIEVEWQFDSPDLEAVANWLADTHHAGFAITPAPTRRLHDTYFDTPGWHIHHAGFTCRIRRRAGAAELTLKSMASAVDGVRSRREVNEPLPRESSSLADATGACRALLDAIAGGEAPRRLFEIHTARRVYMVNDARRAIAEVALDATSLPSHPGAPVLRRVEVEVQGDALELARAFVRDLIAATNLQPAKRSKFAFALASAGIAPPATDQ